MFSIDGSQNFKKRMSKIKNDIFQLVEKGEEFNDQSVIEKSQELDKLIVAFMKNRH